MFLIKNYFIFFLLFLSFRLSAQELPTIQTDRPDQTESPFLVPARHLQVEAGFLFEQTDKDNTSYDHPSLLIKYGVNEYFELRFIPEYVTQHTSTKKLSGVSPVTFGMKIKMAEEKGILPQVGFIGHIISNIASKGLKSTWFAPAFRFTLQNTITPALSLGYNFGMEWNGETPEPAYIYTLSLAFSLTEKLGAYTEAYGFLSRYTRPDHRVDGGFTYLLKKNILLDLSGGIGITPHSPDYYIASGISFRLKD